MGSMVTISDTDCDTIARAGSRTQWLTFVMVKAARVIINAAPTREPRTMPAIAPSVRPCPAAGDDLLSLLVLVSPAAGTASIVGL